MLSPEQAAEIKSLIDMRAANSEALMVLVEFLTEPFFNESDESETKTAEPKTVAGMV